MPKRFVFAPSVGIVIVMLGVGVWLAAHPSRPVAVMLHPAGPADQRLWPLNMSWVWSVKPLIVPDPGKAIAAVVRVNPKGGDLAVMMPASRESCLRQYSTSLLQIRKAEREAIAAFQLIDLNEIGAGPAEGDGNLRLRFNLWIEGSGSVFQEGLSIDGKRCTGWSPIYDPQWRDGELHLLTFRIGYSHGGEITYDVFLTATEPLPGAP